MGGREIISKNWEVIFIVIVLNYIRITTTWLVTDFCVYLCLFCWIVGLTEPTRVVSHVCVRVHLHIQMNAYRLLAMQFPQQASWCLYVCVYQTTVTTHADIWNRVIVVIVLLTIYSLLFTLTFYNTNNKKVYCCLTHSPIHTSLHMYVCTWYTQVRTCIKRNSTDISKIVLECHPLFNIINNIILADWVYSH